MIKQISADELYKSNKALSDSSTDSQTPSDKSFHPLYTLYGHALEIRLNLTRSKS